MKRKPHLRCFILVWDYGTLYALERDPFTRWRFGWRMPSRVRFGFDDNHPIGASHHQKILVVDDRLAFSGGIDLTGHRWDTSEHRPDEPGRVTPIGTRYDPYHEVQIMVEGPVAAALGELARGRWRALGAQKIPPIAARTGSLWPADVPVDLSDVSVGIARTVPGSGSQPPIKECEALFLDSIAAARREIYIESQYFTSARLGDALAERLTDPNGPELIVISPKECYGWLEKNTMGKFRDEVFRRLIAADSHKRLRLVQPMASRERDCPTFVHSKVMVVDDDFLRIGSANFSNRSLGVDTECDLAVEAGDARTAADIRRVRNRMLGEHLGMTSDEVAAGLEKYGTLCALVDASAARDKTLLRVEVAPEAEAAPEAVQAVADPEEPMGFGPAADRLLPALDVTTAPSHLRLWILPATVILAAVIVAWSSTGTGDTLPIDWLRAKLEELPASHRAMLIAPLVLIPMALVLPVELLIIAAGFLFGVRQGGLTAFAGALGAAATGYGLGRTLGPGRLARWVSPQSYRTGRQLCARGPAAVATLRFAAASSAGALHMLCGASRIGFVEYLLGSSVGLLPIVVALSTLGGLLRHTFLAPTFWNGLLTIGAALFLTALAAGIRVFLLIRQFTPVAATHRSRAEFG